MSLNEFEFMKLHKENYYIYFVKDAEKPYIVQRIRSNRLIGLQKPAKYNFSLKRT